MSDSYDRPEEILAAVLDCGWDDWRALKGVSIDLRKLYHETWERMAGDLPTLNDLIDQLFEDGVCWLKEKVDDKVSDLSQKVNDPAHAMEREKLLDELNEIRKLNPINDIGWSANCIASDIYFSENGDIYNTFFTSELEEFEDRFGYSITG